MFCISPVKKIAPYTKSDPSSPDSSLIKTLDKSNNSISINKNAVAPFKISGFNIQGDKLTLNLNYSIKSITDITNLFSHKMPEGVTNYVKKMFGN